MWRNFTDLIDSLAWWEVIVFLAFAIGTGSGLPMTVLMVIGLQYWRRDFGDKG